MVTTWKIRIKLVEAFSRNPHALVSCALIPIITIDGFVDALTSTVIAIILCALVIVVTAVWTLLFMGLFAL